MTIQALKNQILSNKVPNTFIIFVTEKGDTNKKFIAEQYAKQIAANKQLELKYLDELDYSHSDDIFSTFESTELENYRLYFTPDFKVTTEKLLQEDKLIVIADKVSFDKTITQTVIDIINKQIVIIPKVEEWQVIDYIMSRADGVNTETSKWLYNLYKGDIYRIDSELDKISLFSPREQQIIIEEFKKESIFEDVSNDNIFSITNALTHKDVAQMGELYKYKDIFIKPRDGEMGFIALLYKAFKNLILVKTSSNPTPQTIGLSEKQIWAISKIPLAYSKSQLLQIFDIVSDMDRRIKAGELDTTYVVDYLIIKILSI